MLRHTSLAFLANAHYNIFRICRICRIMTGIFLPILLFSTTLSAENASAVALVPKETAAALIGTVVKEIGPKDYQGTAINADVFFSQVVYQSAQLSLGVSVFNFSSAAAARAKMTKEYASTQIHADDVSLVEESGLGERAYWAESSDNVAYIALKGSHAVAIACVNLEDDTKLIALRPALRKMAASALGKLP